MVRVDAGSPYGDERSTADSRASDVLLRNTVARVQPVLALSSTWRILGLISTLIGVISNYNSCYLIYNLSC